MSNGIEQPLTVREKIVNLIDEYQNIKNEHEEINGELNSESQARHDAENQASHLHRQVQLVEVNLDAKTAKVEHLTKQLIEVLKVSEAAKQICNTLESQIHDVNDKETQLDSDVKQSKASTLETDKRFQETTSKLTAIHERMEQAERRSLLAEQRIATLQQDIRNANKEFKVLQDAEEKRKVKEKKYQDDIVDLQTRLKTAQERTDNAEADVEKLQTKFDKLQENLSNERKKCQEIEKQLKKTSD